MAGLKISENQSSALIALIFGIGVVAISIFFIGQGYSEHKSQASFIDDANTSSASNARYYSNVVGGSVGLTAGVIAVIFASIVFVKDKM